MATHGDAVKGREDSAGVDLDMGIFKYLRRDGDPHGTCDRRDPRCLRSPNLQDSGYHSFHEVWQASCNSSVDQCSLAQLCWTASSAFQAATCTSRPMVDESSPVGSLGIYSPCRVVLHPTSWDFIMACRQGDCS
eukprot:Skav215746  [mRNA]  locus=scaffold106:120587:120988:+ [translate_table: standard]